MPSKFVNSRLTISTYFLKHCITAFLIISFLVTTKVTARELAADGDAVSLTIEDSYKCSEEAAIKISTQSTGYFDLGAETIQRLADTSGAILGFECPNITKIIFTGMTDGTVVFSADAKSETNWSLESEPAPLEKLALFLSLYEPEFFHLAALHDQVQPYIGISGMADSYQYKAYEKQAGRFISIIDGDTTKFQEYLKNPGRDFGSFENALAHYGSILKTIKKYAPDQFAGYEKAYAETTESLKNDYWSAQVDIIMDNEEQTISEIVEKTKLKAESASSPEFSTFVDTHIASKISEEATFVKERLKDASLFELAHASDFVAGFPDPTEIETLPTIKALLQSLPDEIVPLILERKDTLLSLATDMIRESGSSYEDTDLILETGFSLAEEFEEAGYPDGGQALIAATVDHIESVLKTGLKNYKAGLEEIELNGETVIALQEQAVAFEELGTQFQGFAAYHKAIEDKLNTDKESICINILKDADVSSSDYGKRILMGDDSSISLTTLACDLHENGHTLSEFSSKWRPDEYTLGISEADGEESRFLLKADSLLFGKDLHVQKRLGEDETSVDKSEWQEYIAQLVLPPPSGKPDANGVRECDQLAADPYDAKKLAPGIDFETAEIDPDTFDRAIEACIAAVEDDPDDSRQQFQLGRLLWYAGDQEAAAEYMTLAASDNYAPAIYYQAEILLGTSDDQSVFIDALAMFEASGNAGYERGLAMVKELNPDGIDFYKEMPPPSSSNILAALPRTKVGGTMLGITSSARIVDINVKSCFQTSATDFSCEFRKILRCSMSGRGNDPLVKFMSNVMQADCNTTEYEFGSFRKLEEGKWREVQSNS